MEKTLLGVNIAWWNGGYCHDLGVNYMHSDWPVTFNEDLVRSTFQYLKSINVNLVRFWLFEGGEGLLFDENKKITGLDPAFEKNLIRHSKLAKEFDLKMYYTLFDANSVFRNKDFITESIICKSDNTKIFCDLILPRILDIIHPTTWAIDLCNEPEAVVPGETGNYTSEGYGWKEVMTNLETLFHSIRKKYPGIKMSIGSGFQEERNLEEGIYENIGFPLDFLDYHSHRTDGYVPPHSTFKNKEVVIGELSACEKLKENPSKEEWRKNQDLILNKLHSLKEDKYKAIFLWRLNPITEQFYNEQADTLTYRAENSTVLYNLHQFI